MTKIKTRTIVTQTCNWCWKTASSPKQDVTFTKVFTCLVCNEEYQTKEEALACTELEAQEAPFMPGTKVRIPKSTLFRKPFTAALQTPLYAKHSNTHIFRGFTAVKGPIRVIIQAGSELTEAVQAGVEWEAKQASKTKSAE